MEHAEVYALEAASAPLSPKLIQEKSQPQQPSTPSEPVRSQQQTPNGVNNRSLTNCFKASQSISCLETLHENSKDVNEMDSVCFDQSFDPNATPQKRKRKFVSPDQPSTLVKRKRDKSYSERKRKVSDFFKTPINYFSSRRRTIDTTFSQTLNESIISSSGVFAVETVQNLSYCNENDLTPRATQKRTKKNLFSRTFSSSKFSRSKSKKTSDLNATRLSFAEADGREKMNASCFPDISLNPVFTNATSELSSEYSRVLRRTSVPAAAVLTSFLHTIVFFIWW